MKFTQFVQTLQFANALPQFNKILEQYLNELGINTFAFTYYSYYPNSLNKLKYDFSSANFSRWHKHYISEGYEDVDSTLEIVYRTCIPTFWDLQEQLKASKTPREKKFAFDLN